jgi:transposase
MAAMRAARISPKLKDFADRIPNASKVRKIAIIATARKLLTILNAMLREKATYKLQ